MGMKIATGNIPSIVTEYFDSVIMPSAMQAGGLKAFTVGFVGGLVSRQTPAMVEQYLPMAKALGLVDEQGYLNIDLAFEEAEKALSKSPVVVAGYRVDREDLVKILEISRKHSV
jgi:hypothetical protein